MAVKRAFNIKEQFFDNSGNPLNGGKLFFYVAGSSTKQTTYNSSLGTVANSNPMVLDAYGRLQSEVWLTTGVLYKEILTTSTDTDPPVSAIWTEDNIGGINDAAIAINEWVAGPAPTFVSATSFTLVGDQTTLFSVGRRLKLTVSAGTVYATIVSSSFAVLTTLTVSVDSGAVDSGLSAVSYGLLAADNSSVGSDTVNRKGNAVVSAATTNIWATNGNEVHITGSTGPITSFGTAFYSGNRRLVIFDSTPTVTAGANLQIQGVASGSSVTVAVGDRWEVVADTTSSMLVTRIPASGTAPVALLPNDYITGFTLTNNGTTGFDIASGQAMDSTNTSNVIGAAIANKTQSAWAVGTGNGGKLSAAAMANNTWYYWFALWKTTDGTVDYGFDVSTTPTLPSGYSKFRYLGGRKTAAAATTWPTFIQHGDDVFWSTPPALDQNGVGTAARTLVTVNVPAVKVNWFGHARALGGAAANQGIYFTDPAVADIAAQTSGGTPLSSMAGVAPGTANTEGFGQVRCWTNTSSQIGVAVVNTTPVIQFVTIGWTDPRGKPV